ncbi:MAG TPA: hypothetical protein PLM62_02280 [Zoogloea sp.]|nr:hypothetical protein [Zoogloea sp.]
MASAAHSNAGRLHPAIGPRLYGSLMALLALAGLVGWFLLYPLDRWLAAALLATYAALVVFRPASCLLILPMLWPLVDLAPWSGHIYLNESDALVLATLFGLGLRESLAPPPVTLTGRAPAKLKLAALGVFGLLAVSVAVSGARGLSPLPALDAAALVGYGSTLNALRVGKGFVLAFALIPFIHLAIRRDGEIALGRIVSGFTFGFATCAVAALWERMSFPGLTNFASDYRSTALFWEMHVGGAALDAWLCLSFPFCLLYLRMARSTAARVAALVVIAVGSYALFTTFSRIVYAAVFASAAVMGLMALLRPGGVRSASGGRGSLVVLALLAGGALGACLLSFQSGGYRGMGAFAGLVVLAYLGGGSLHGARAGQLIIGGLAGLALAGPSLLAAWWIPKGPYLIYGLSAGVALWLLVNGLRRQTPPAPALVTALLVWTALNAVLVCVHWGEGARVPEALLAAGMVLAVLVTQSASPRPLWVPQLHRLHVVGGVLVVGGMVISTLGSYYMGSRLAATGDDLHSRTTHFAHGLGMVRGADAVLFGLGLGRYPDSYFWKVPDPGVPGFLALQGGAGERYMRIGGERHATGSGEVLRLTQRIASDAALPFHFRVRARADKDVRLYLRPCRKHLLYAEDCVTAAADLKGGSGWQDLELKQWTGGEGFARPGWPPRPASLSIHVDGRGQVDVDDVQAFDGQLRPLLRNGDFERGVDYWFFSSDRDHLPWHAKNIFVHSYVEQGLFGLATLVLALLAAAAHLLRAPTRLHPLAPVLLASLAGVTTVGLVDSLLDMPRITLMIMLVLWLSLSLRQPSQ